MSRRRHDSLGTIDTINVTPLVDLTFLLLIVFMITAPVLEYTVEVNTPELTAQQVDQQEHRIVSIDASGFLYFGDTRISMGELGQALTLLVGQMPTIQVFIRADESRPYGEVMAVLRTIKRSGVTNFNLVTSAEED